MRQGRLFVISGPSGAGKGTICKELIKTGEMMLSISMTTRSPRNGEVHGQHYYFVSKEEFQKTVDENGFLEHASIYENCYGTPKRAVLDMLDKGQDIILEIEMQGAMQVKAAYPKGTLIFVLPPSLAELRKRLIERGTEDEEQIRIRLKTTLDEIGRINDYDYFVINDDLEKAVNTIRAIVKAEHSKVTDDMSGIVKRYEEE